MLGYKDRLVDPYGSQEAETMDNWTFGLTLLVVGMGGTMAALGLLAAMMNLLKKIFPVKEEEPK